MWQLAKGKVQLKIRDIIPFVFIGVLMTLDNPSIRTFTGILYMMLWFGVLAVEPIFERKSK